MNKYSQNKALILSITYLRLNSLTIRYIPRVKCYFTCMNLSVTYMFKCSKWHFWHICRVYILFSTHTVLLDIVSMLRRPWPPAPYNFSTSLTVFRWNEETAVKHFLPQLGQGQKPGLSIFEVSVHLTDLLSTWLLRKLFSRGGPEGTLAHALMLKVFW